MRGTILCGVTESEEGREALAIAVELSERLDLRLVLAHVVEGIGRVDGDGEGTESVSMRGSRERAVRVVARLAAEHGVTHTAAQRSAVGDPAALMGQIAAEEAADLIVVSARPHSWFRWGGLDSRLAERLEKETPVPVLIPSPRTRARRSVAMAQSPR
jgi:nucleotide-binding universal stress UspA family protein